MRTISNEEQRCLVKGVSLPRWMIQAIKEIAIRDKRSFSSYVREALKVYLEREEI